jgi:hypothetical protein
MAASASPARGRSFACFVRRKQGLFVRKNIGPASRCVIASSVLYIHDIFLIPALRAQRSPPPTPQGNYFE